MARLRLLTTLAIIAGSTTSSTLFAQCEIHEDAKLTASDAEVRDAFGYSVSVSGDVVLVGAMGDDCLGGQICGSAYVYRFNGSTWVEEGKLSASDAAQGDQFGASVSISGNTAVVGSVFGDFRNGSAYIYRFNGNTWVQERKLSAPEPGGYFGGSVSVSGDVVLVGEGGEGCAAGPWCGSAYVYRFNGNTWVQQAKLIASDAASSDYFGGSVSVSGNTAVVGAMGADCGAGVDCGSAYVYQFNGSNWVQQGKLTASDAAQEDSFGFSVSVSGNTAVVGALYGDCGAGVDCGSAYVYQFNGSNWVQQAKLTASDAASSDFFGGSVSVSGNKVVVGARYSDCGAGVDCGSAYVYQFNGSNWVQQAKLTASDAASSNFFGISVSVSGDVAVVGAHTAGGGCGSAYIYAIVDISPSLDCNANGIPDECDISSGNSQDCNANGVPDECENALTLCDDGVPCTIDSCDEVAHTCTHVPNDAACDDGLFCNGTETCDALLGCRPGTSINCDDGIDCTIDTCDESMDRCENTPNDALCDDGNPCNGTEICESLMGCVRTLGADCNANAIEDNCDIAGGGSEDANTNGIPDECEPGACCEPDGACNVGLQAACTSASWSVGLACEPNPCAYMTEVTAAGCRYLRMTPNPTANPANPIALRVTRTDIPCPPRYVALDSGIGRLIDNPVYRLGSQWGTVLVADSELIPGGTYMVQMESALGTSAGVSATLPRWGDVVGVSGNDPPDGSVDFQDIAGIVDRFKSWPGAPPIERCDLDPAIPDQVIDFSDISDAVDAFKGQPYPFAAPCP